MKNAPQTHRTSDKGTVQFARELRKNKTRAEAQLWRRLRKKAVGSFRFRQQHPIGTYIADFYCNEVGLVVEIDGGVHSEADQKERDHIRDIAMKEYGLTILRFTNRMVFENLDDVVNTIKKALLDTARNKKD